MAQSVAILLPSYGPLGVVRSMFRLGAGLWAEGVDVDLVVLSGREQPPFPVPSGLKAVHLKAPSLMHAARHVAAYLKRRQPNAVLAASNPSALAAVRGRRLSETRGRVVISLRNQLSKLWELERDRIPEQMVERMKIVYPRADAVVALSSGVADDLSRLIGLPRERIRVIYNGIDIPESLQRAAQPVEHPWMDSEGGPPLILGVGRLAPQKDFPTLLRAFAQVRAEREARLLILGSGALEQQLREQARELGIVGDFSLPGFIENPLPYVRQASVFALSSAFEGLANVVLEALAVGTPVVSTDCPSGPRELLDGGTYGPLVPVGDADALAQAILRTLDQPLPRERLLKRAGEFSVERMVGEHLDVLLG